jgi:hypothetical protein
LYTSMNERSPGYLLSNAISTLGYFLSNSSRLIVGCFEGKEGQTEITLRFKGVK